MTEKQSLDSILAQIAKEHNFVSPKVALDKSPTQGYLANVNIITLKDDNPKKSKNKETVLHLFAKMIPEDTTEEFRFLYANESVFYTQIYPEFRKMIPQNSSLCLPRVPKMYFANNDMVVLENLTESGFKVWNPLNKHLDSEHIKSVLKTYGVFHGFSFAWKYKNPEKFKTTGLKFEWFITHFDKLMNAGYFKSISEKIAGCFDEKTEFKYMEAIARFFSDDLLAYLQELEDSDENDIFVHGDCWTHNFMFKYDENSNLRGPKEVCLIDFQIFRKTSTVSDLSYFLGCCADIPKVYYNLWDDYFKVYHESLTKTLVQLNCPKDLYSWEKFQRDWNKFSPKGGLVMAAFVYKMMIADPDELEARKEIPLPMQFDFISRNEEKYQKHIRELVKYYCDSGLIKC